MNHRIPILCIKKAHKHRKRMDESVQLFIVVFWDGFIANFYFLGVCFCLQWVGLDVCLEKIALLLVHTHIYSFILSTLPGKSHWQRSLAGCSPWGRDESDTTERLHFPLSCIGEGNGNPIQCCCLENPRDGRACWAAVYGVAQSRRRLKQLSSSSSSRCWQFDLWFLCLF